MNDIIRNLKVNEQAIANGLYAMITDKGEEAIVAFGMIPKWVIDSLDKNLDDKLWELFAKQIELPVAEARALLIDGKEINKLKSEIIHKVTLGIYQAASDAGKMVV